MIIKLTERQYSWLLNSSFVCGACKEILEIYDENKYFDTEKLTRQQLIHIETTTRRADLVK